MKKVFDWCVLLSLLFWSCGSDSDSSSEAGRDELLSGTTWVDSFLDRVPSENGSDDNLFFDNPLVKFLNQHPEIKYTTGGVVKSEVMDTVWGTSEVHVKKLQFGNGECSYSSATEKDAVVKRYQSMTETYTLAAGEYAWNDQHIKVMADGIYTCEADGSQLHRYIILNNYSARIFRGRELVKEEKVDCSEEVEEIKMSYIRTEGNVVMQNEEVKWVGNLDMENWAMRIVQLTPERKEIGDFELK